MIKTLFFLNSNYEHFKPNHIHPSVSYNLSKKHKSFSTFDIKTENPNSRENITTETLKRESKYKSKKDYQDQNYQKTERKYSCKSSKSKIVPEESIRAVTSSESENFRIIKKRSHSSMEEYSSDTSKKHARERTRDGENSTIVCG